MIIGSIILFIVMSCAHEIISVGTKVDVFFGKRKHIPKPPVITPRSPTAMTYDEVWPNERLNKKWYQFWK
jgi:hypothetical protein